MSKNIIICCDGTGNEFSENNTNVIGTYVRFEKDANQIGFYDTGVGTFNPIGLNLGPISKGFGTLMGSAFGYGIKKNIEDAYTYLMDHYQPGDKVFIFGFSRGAYTVRLLAGVLTKCGLLQKGHKNQIETIMKFAFKEVKASVVKKFRANFCFDCDPHFIGVWDTVASVGHLHPTKHFKDGILNHKIPYGYHAISIDEERKKFPVNLWDETQKADQQTIEQVWFAGVHSDVGGWYDERGLSDIALKWMLEKAENCGLRLREGWQEDLECDPLGPSHNSRNSFWKMWRPVARVIPEGSQIHESVVTRMQEISYEAKLPHDYKVSA